MSWKSIVVRVGVVALIGAASTVVQAPQAAEAATTYIVTNYDHDGTKGVYLRNAPDLGNVTRDAAHYLTYGTGVQLICYSWGTSVASVGNRVWHQVSVTSGSNAGRVGWLSDHWLNTPVKANQIVPGEAQCGSTTTPTPPSDAKVDGAVAWAQARLGATRFVNADGRTVSSDDACLAFTRAAWASQGVDLRRQVSVSWGSNTYPQDIWGHLTAGRTGTGTPPKGALVFYLAKAGRSKIYSHITIAVDGAGNTVSTNDTVNRGSIHPESISQHGSSGAYNSYVGWWLPSH